MAVIAGGIAAAHLLGAGYLLSRRDLPESKRQLGLAFCATVPLLGLLLAAMAASIRSRGGSPAIDAVEIETKGGRRRPTRLKDRKPILDRLIGSPAERRAALANAVNAPSREIVAALRWTVEHGEGDAVIETALTLEEIETRHHERIARTSSALGDHASPRDLVTVANLVSDLLHRGLADSTLTEHVAAEARDLYRRAARASDGAPAEIYVPWARLELAAMQPERALELLEECDQPADPSDAAAYRELIVDVRFAARKPADRTRDQARLLN